MAGGLRIADAPLVTDLDGTEKLAVDNGTNTAVACTTDQIKELTLGSSQDSSTIAGRVTNLETNLANEVQTRTSEVNSLNTNKANITYVDSEILGEKTARQNADNALSQDISNETTARQNADNALDTAKADKVNGATSGHLAGLDANGNLTDSGSGIDATPTQGSDNVVKSGGVYDALDTLDTDKADKVSGAISGHLAGLDNDGNLTDSGSGIDNAPTNGSTNVVKSGGVYTALDGKTDKVNGAVNGHLAGLDNNGNLVDSGVGVDATPLQGSPNMVTSDGIYNALDTMDASKVDKVSGATIGDIPTFNSDGGIADTGINVDGTPTVGSNNVVTSGGVYNAIGTETSARVQGDADERAYVLTKERVAAEGLDTLDRRVATLEDIIANGFTYLKVNGRIDLRIREGLYLVGAGTPSSSVIPDGWIDEWGDWQGIPLYRGQEYYDSTNEVWYKAINNTAVTDWKQITN